MLFLQRPVGFLYYLDDPSPQFVDVFPGQAWWWLVVDTLQGPGNRIPPSTLTRIFQDVFPEVPLGGWLRLADQLGEPSVSPIQARRVGLVWLGLLAAADLVLRLPRDLFAPGPAPPPG